MRMTWEEQATVIIAAIDATLLPDASIKERKRALLAGKPYEYRVTSWGSKTWGRAQRKYLAKFGPKSDACVPPKHLSPLERLMAKSNHTERA